VWRRVLPRRAVLLPEARRQAAEQRQVRQQALARRLRASARP
jgi:hypothetical protein